MAYGDRTISRLGSSGGTKYTSKQISKNRKKTALGLVGGGAVAAVGMYALSNMGDSKSSDSSSSQNSTGTGSSGDEEGTGSGGDSSGSGETKKQVVEIPIDNYEEALQFALNEWHKIRRDDGRQVECTVLGATNWKCGEWSKVVLPSYEINEYMYITRMSHSNQGGEWTANISLVDYPPGWGEEQLENEEEENTDESEDESSADEEETTDDDSASEE